MRIGFIGLGHMGRGIAKNLLGAGHALAIYNRTRAKADELARDAKGATVVGSPGDAADGAEVVFTMLADDEAESSVVFGDRGLLTGLARGAVHVALSTIGPSMSRRLAEAHRAAGQLYVAAPVLGRPEAAENAQLVVLAAGSREGIARCTPLFDKIGKKTRVLGEAPEKANVVKLGVNFMLAAVLETLGEAYALVERFGVRDEEFLEVASSLFGSQVIESYGKRIAEDQFEPAGFQLKLGLKDVRLALDAGESARVPMPIASVLRDRFVDALARGLEDSDWSAVARRAGNAA